MLKALSTALSGPEIQTHQDRRYSQDFPEDQTHQESAQRCQCQSHVAITSLHGTWPKQRENLLAEGEEMDAREEEMDALCSFSRAAREMDVHWPVDVHWPEEIEHNRYVRGRLLGRLLLMPPLQPGPVTVRIIGGAR